MRRDARPRIRGVCALLVLAFVLSACGSDEDASTEGSDGAAMDSSAASVADEAADPPADTGIDGGPDDEDFTDVPGYVAFAPTIEDVRSAAVAAGFACAAAPADPVGSAYRIDCSGSSLIAWFPSAEDLQAELADQTGDLNPRGDLQLVGENWVINASAEAIRSLAPAMGGTIIPLRDYE